MTYPLPSTIIAVLVVCLIAYIPLVICYHLMTSNGRKHLRLRHRAGQRGAEIDRVGPARAPLQVNPIPYLAMSLACLAIGLMIVGNYLWW